MFYHHCHKQPSNIEYSNYKILQSASPNSSSTCQDTHQTQVGEEPKISQNLTNLSHTKFHARSFENPLERQNMAEQIGPTFSKSKQGRGSTT